MTGKERVTCTNYHYNNYYYHYSNCMHVLHDIVCILHTHLHKPISSHCYYSMDEFTRTGEQFTHKNNALGVDNKLLQNYLTTP